MCTEIFCWNVRGFNVHSHRNGFKKWYKATKPIFGGLIETHVKQQKRSKFINELLPGWLFDDNYGFSELGKIWVIWHPSVQVTILSKSLQMVTCDVLLPNSPQSMVISLVYASNLEDSRKFLWSEIRDVAASVVNTTKPWILLGDLNQTISP
ncbi:hypothetical protein N665_0090s0055 [Sinapis alba]|nr:hypothetical protein N665_0090s0055 [Sinapis alba]